MPSRIQWKCPRNVKERTLVEHTLNVLAKECVRHVKYFIYKFLCFEDQIHRM